MKMDQRTHLEKLSSAETTTCNADVREDAMECLIYADGAEDRGKQLASALRGNGIGATRPVKPDECFDLLARRSWGCLVLIAAGDTRDVLEVLMRCRRTFPEVPPLVLVKRGDIDAAVQMMKAGAADCMETPVETGRLLTAITFLCRRAEDGSRDCRARLTPMERTVLGHILEGHTNREIARALCRSPRTIEVHRRHIMRKLGATNLVDLVRQTMHTDSAALLEDESMTSAHAAAPGRADVRLEGKRESR